MTSATIPRTSRFAEKSTLTNTLCVTTTRIRISRLWSRWTSEKTTLHCGTLSFTRSTFASRSVAVFPPNLSFNVIVTFVFASLHCKSEHTEESSAYVREEGERHGRMTPRTPKTKRRKRKRSWINKKNRNQAWLVIMKMIYEAVHLSRISHISCSRSLTLCAVFSDIILHPNDVDHSHWICLNNQMCLWLSLLYLETFYSKTSVFPELAPNLLEQSNVAVTKLIEFCDCLTGNQCPPLNLPVFVSLSAKNNLSHFFNSLTSLTRHSFKPSRT